MPSRLLKDQPERQRETGCPADANRGVYSVTDEIKRAYKRF